VAIGYTAGNTNQKGAAIAIGYGAGNTSQGSNAIAIGNNAGYTNQPDYTIILNALGDAFNGVTGVTGATYIRPIRNDNSVTDNVISYNISTNEVIYRDNLPTPVLSYYLSGSTGNVGGSVYTLKCDNYDDANSGNTGNFKASYDSDSGYLYNSTSTNLSYNVNLQIAAEQGNWNVMLYKGNTGSAANVYWQNQQIGVYNTNTYNYNVLLKTQQYVYIDYNISGPTGYTLYGGETGTRIQFTQLNAF